MSEVTLYHVPPSFYSQIARLALDIAGGFIATLPSEHDLKSEEVGHLVKKYFSGVEGIPVEDRIKIGKTVLVFKA